MDSLNQFPHFFFFFTIHSFTQKNIFIECLFCARLCSRPQGWTPVRGYRQYNFTYQKKISVCHFRSNFRREFVITCPTFWCWLVPASQVSEEVGCRHRMSLPSQEPGQGHFLYPEAVLPADTERQPHRRPQTS